MVPVFVDPGYAIDVVKEIELRISNTSSIIQDLMEGGEPIDSPRIKQRESLLKFMNDVLELKATKSIDTTPPLSTEPGTTGE